MLRTHWSSETPKLVGKTVSLAGFVASRRDHGKLLFLDLSDAKGIIQVVFEDNRPFFDEATRLTLWSTVKVEGEVRKRPPKLVNSKIPTGTVELLAANLQVFSKAETAPLPLEGEGLDLAEDLRMRWRYLDLRRPRLAENLRRRFEITQFIRDWLAKHDFIEVETPILTKGTPEGAREFIVPSRLHPGKFYVLPQSPQQFKQLLMVAGFERYFQIARCFRDEDPRGDRQPEFTQLDVEMAWVEQEDILKVVEELFHDLIHELFPKKALTAFPFPRLSWRESLERFESDKPDLRNRKADNELAFAFIINWPLFEKKEGRLDPSHHIFTAPKPEDLSLLNSDPAKCHSLQHDLVLNGLEIGGGSIRITDPALQRKIFELVGLSKSEYQHRFGHLLDAFRFGVPPHGGIAIGLDRFLAILFGERNIREVIAFPKTGDARDLMIDAPSELPSKTLAEVHIAKAGGK